ncbi:hypothetical protein ONZ51_g3247 [Trametes cubensis]|uniref:RPEL repeat protein n=1 Tax=Trametes cubensis TaxID=1111947 RepID=A0AAD7TY68_9APHY|nr:hypothetical protein ONZ51_g3247 [Trametes cubensis]
MSTVPTTQAPVPPKPVRKPSIDPEAAQKLEKSLAQRPDKHELIERNILKEMEAHAHVFPARVDDSVAPSLQAAKEKLQRSQLEDKLEHALQARPKPEELVKGGILKETDAPPA